MNLNLRRKVTKTENQIDMFLFLNKFLIKKVQLKIRKRKIKEQKVDKHYLGSNYK
jgi:hypothetical protein